MSKRKRLTLEEKMKILDLASVNPMSSTRQIAKEFGIGKTQATEILIDENSLHRAWATNANSNANNKRRITDGTEIDEKVLKWFSKARESNLQVSGTDLQQEALEVATSLGMNDFKAFNGWLHQFKKRHNIMFKKISSEAAGVDLNCVEIWKIRQEDIIKNYNSQDIFSADQVGLFFEALPNQTMSLKNEKCIEGKNAEHRLTILLCCNVVGKFEKPLVIGNAKQPKAFEKVKPENLPVEWRWNDKTWITSEIMTDWLLSLDRKMIKQKRKILLLLDSIAAHPRLKLRNVELAFLYPNTTSPLQPLHQGIIQNFKKLYHLHLSKRVIVSMDDYKKPSKLLNVFDAVNWISQSIKKITSGTVRKCFLRSGFVKHSAEEDILNDSTIDQGLEKLMKLVNESVTCKEYLTIDDNLLTYDDEAAIVGSQNVKQEPKDDGEDDLVVQWDLVYKSNINTLADALEAISQVRKFLTGMDVNETTHHLGAEFESEIVNELLKNK